MNEATRARLYDYTRAFYHPFTITVVVAIVALLVLAGVLLPVLHRRKLTGDDVHRELCDRWKSWGILSVLMIAPILLGAAWTIGAVCVLSLCCFGEFARTTGLFREKMLCACVAAGVLLVAFAAFDHYDRLFFAAAPVTVVFLCVATLYQDRPKGYVQRTALGVLGFLLFGFSMGYIGNIANTGDVGNGADYRPLLLLLIVAVELNDVFAYCSGKLIGGPKLLPETSPGKTVAGAMGAMILTTALVAALGAWLFRGTPMQEWHRLLTLGVIISGLGQLGDLVLSSIKRDVGVKDTGRLIPGHGGLLDRFDSLVLVAPAVYHYLSLSLEQPLGAGETVRIVTGG